MDGMTAQQQRIRQQTTALGRRGVTSRVPDGLRDEIVAYARGRRHGGASWRTIAAEIGFSASALKLWTATARRSLVPVTVRTDASAVEHTAGLVLVAPNGVRVEGLDVTGAAMLLRALA